MRAALLALMAILLTGPAAASAAPPNIVVILADDQGWGDLSLNGNANLRTPNIDSLARDGASLERFYVAPLCAPTRAEFLTGRYHPRGGVRGVTRGEERLDTDVKTIADALKGAGYSTGLFGKWHNGSQHPYHPNARGFDEFYGYTSGHWGDYFDAPMEHNGEIVQGKGFMADDLTDRAMEFIGKHRARPFFCMLSFNTPHSPYQAPDAYHDRFKSAEIARRYPGPEKEDLAETRCVLAMCENLDWNVGRLLGRLRDDGIAERTIVVYFSDNGPNTWRWNGGMKGRKGTVDEGGVRSPCLIRWPGAIEAGAKIAPIAGAIDLLPTLADLSGIPLAPAKPLDGVSLAPLLRGERHEWPERMIFSYHGGKASVRTQRHRLDADGRLFDMESDPGQARDIAGQEPETARRLRGAVAAWREEVLPKAARDERPFPVGHADAPTTFLPARDGVAHGSIKRSGGAPNCSFFTNWVSAEDYLAWDVEALEAGDYEATLYYTCPARSVGCEMELELNGATARRRVEEAFDPPLRGMEHDRAPRKSESFVKDFRPLALGRIRLQTGRGRLTLRAANVTGGGAVDVRMIELRRAR